MTTAQETGALCEFEIIDIAPVETAAHDSDPKKALAVAETPRFAQQIDADLALTGVATGAQASCSRSASL